MFTNYLIIALRNLLRHKLYACINLIGLAAGLACCVLAITVIQHARSFDRFHPHAERIYRVLRERTSGDQKQVRWLTSGGLARALEEEIPEIERASKNRIYPVDVRQNNQTFQVVQGHVDASFFKLFAFPFQIGSPDLLEKPYAAAITQKTARRLFGNADPIGQIVTIQERYYGGDYAVVAVLKDPPTHSSLQFDLLHMTGGRTDEAKIDWTGWQGHVQQAGIETFVLLRDNQNPQALETKLSDVIERHMGSDVRAILSYRLQPMLRMYLYSLQDYGLADIRSVRPQGNIQSLYTLSAIAGLILLIAGINFVNLATARSTGRAREVGLRKIVGAHRHQLVAQFLGESILTALLALVIAIGLAQLALPTLNDLTQNRLSLAPDALLPMLPILLVLTLIAGLAAGVYPAFYLSGFRPADVLKRAVGPGGHRFRQLLVIAQFAIAILLIVTTDVIHQQRTYMQNKSLGFQTDHVVLLPIFLRDRESKTNNDPWLSARYNTVKDAFLTHPNVLAASAFRFRPGWGGGFVRIVKPEGQEGVEWRMPVQEADEDFFNTLEIPLLAGRTFSPTIERDRTHAYILNETAVRAFGWTIDNAVGRRFGRARFEEDAKGAVIGVVADFHYDSLREPIGPAAIAYRQWFYEDLALRIRPQNWPETRAFLERTWRRFMPPDIPFEYVFLSEGIAEIYQAEARMARIVKAFAGLAIGLACLGLFGLAAFAAARRTREIGIRKVLGATETGIVALLAREFLTLVGLANLIAWPLSFYAASRWLETFAYRITLTPLPFVLAALIALFIALLTVSYHAIRSARTNPADVLRYE